MSEQPYTLDSVSAEIITDPRDIALCESVARPLEAQLADLRAKLAEDEANLRANAAMLARQTDMAREAEARAARAEQAVLEVQAEGWMRQAEDVRELLREANEREAALRKVVTGLRDACSLARDWLSDAEWLDEIGLTKEILLVTLNDALATPSKAGE